MTKVLKPAEVTRDWHLVDAEGKTFGRILTDVATLLRGKHKPSFTPNVDCGDYVVIINAEKAKFTGVKLEEKEYFTHSGYFGSTKSKKLGDMLENHTEKLYMRATSAGLSTFVMFMIFPYLNRTIFMLLFICGRIVPT